MAERYTLKEIKALSDSKLVVEFYWHAVRSTNESNIRGGLTQATAKEEKWFIEEMSRRFNLDADAIDKELNP